MSYLYLTCLRTPMLSAALAAGLFVSAAQAQTPGDEKHGTDSSVPADTTHASSQKASAYYHFTLGHLYEEMAGAYGNRSDYVNKAIENYRLAMKEDPTASFLVEDIAELYRVSGHIRDAVEEAQNALKANPDDLNARRVLAHMYAQEIGDAQTKHVDEGMAQRAIEQYKIIVVKDPKDIESLDMLGRLDRLVGDSVGAEESFKKVLVTEPDNEDAVIGLSAIYTDRNDSVHAVQVLETHIAKTPTAALLIALANNYEQIKQYSKAADAYARAIDLDPARVELKAAMAQDLAYAGRMDDALKAFQELAEANPQEPMPYISMAQIYRQQRNFDKADQMIARAKGLDADNLDMRLEEARVLDAEGKVGDAIAVLKGVIDSANRRSSPVSSQTRADLLDNLGELYRTDRQYDRAVETFRQAASLNNDIATREQGQIIETFRIEKDYGKALAESDAALKKYPNDRTLIEVRAEVLSDEGKTDEAAAQLKKLLDGKNDRQVYLSLADTYGKAKNYDQMAKSIDAADKLSNSDDDRTTIKFLRGSMYEREKRYDLAEKEFRAALAIDPNNASALNYLGYMLADQGVRLQEAQSLIQHAVTLEPNNYAYLDSLGWVDFRLNQLPTAEQELRRSIEMMGTDPTIHDHLGDVYFKEGKLKEAIEQWQSSLNASKASAPSDLEPDEVSKVQKKLDSARVRLAKEQAPPRNQ